MSLPHSRLPNGIMLFLWCTLCVHCGLYVGNPKGGTGKGGQSEEKRASASSPSDSSPSTQADKVIPYPDSSTGRPSVSKTSRYQKSGDEKSSQQEMPLRHETATWDAVKAAQQAGQSFDLKTLAWEDVIDAFLVAKATPGSAASPPLAVVSELSKGPRDSKQYLLRINLRNIASPEMTVSELSAQIKFNDTLISAVQLLGYEQKAERPQEVLTIANPAADDQKTLVYTLELKEGALPSSKLWDITVSYRSGNKDVVQQQYSGLYETTTGKESTEQKLTYLIVSLLQQIQGGSSVKNPPLDEAAVKKLVHEQLPEISSDKTQDLLLLLQKGHSTP